MNAITKLATSALAVAGIIGGAALAQTTLDPNRTDNPATANYSITPGSNLKRDGSLQGDKIVTPVAATSDTSTTTTTTETTTEVTPAAPAPVAVVTTTEAPAAAPVEEAMPPARADRN
jgi:fructose-specific component phosphotransferase system IIB-like protein